jgi:parallel beta-helix repeat protein
MRLGFIVLLMLLIAPAVGARTYYVDCASGSDKASGTTEAGAWKTIEKVSATTFSPGDSILFRRGARCSGSLWPKGSGEEGTPIRMGAYGEGQLPVMEAGAAEAAIKLFDQQYWDIANLETSGGDHYGLHIGANAASGTLRHFHLRNLVVHDATGEVKDKASGSVVISGANGVTLEDVLIDGITAYRTTQWAGIYVYGSRNVVVRNSTVHDVVGDGIVLFQTENGTIEKSAAWLTGLQPRETIGTPNGIWTWSCRNCVVQLTEGFWTDSPGVDGGIYDIDYGNHDNVVQYNYGHDAQGYCVGVFGAEKQPHHKQHRPLQRLREQWPQS